MTDEEIIKKLRIWMENKSCLRCMHWEEQKEICELFKQRPPAKVIVNGCKHHDFIPF